MIEALHSALEATADGGSQLVVFTVRAPSFLVGVVVDALEPVRVSEILAGYEILFRSAQPVDLALANRWLEASEPVALAVGVEVTLRVHGPTRAGVQLIAGFTMDKRPVRRPWPPAPSPFT